MKLNDLPKEEKPRERLLRYGASKLNNEELLAIILRTGTKDKNVKILSSEVLTKINSIEKLEDLSITELTEIKGLGKVKAITVIAAIELGKRVSSKSLTENILLEDTKTIHKYFSHLFDKNQEELIVILIDNRKRLISYKKMYKGTSTETVASAKEIFNYAIKERATAIILIHNHPVGDIYPSEADDMTTMELLKAGELLKIPILDHIITNGREYFSFHDEAVKNEK